MATAVSVPVSRGSSVTSSHSSRRKRSRSEFETDNLDVPAFGADDGVPRKRSKTVSTSQSLEFDENRSMSSATPSTDSRKRRFSQTEQSQSESVLTERSLNKKLKTVHISSSSPSDDRMAIDQNDDDQDVSDEVKQEVDEEGDVMMDKVSKAIGLKT